MTDTVGSRTGSRERRNERSIYLDALRAVALVRVVTYHALSFEWLTIFSAMPLMFFIAGSLFAGSLERRPARQVIRDRYRRILVPYWVYIAAMIALWASLGVLGELSIANWVGVLFPVLSLNGPQGPGAGTDLELTWLALWYLQFHLLLSLAGPWLRRMQQQHTKGLWATLGAMFAVCLAGGIGFIVVVVYVSCWLVGYHQHDGDLERLVRSRWIAICAVTGPLGAGLYLGFEGSIEWSGTALRLAVLGAALLGAFWLTLAMGLRPALEPALRGHTTRSVVHWFSQRSLTIYMWHMVGIYAALQLGLLGTSSRFAVLGWCALFCVSAVVAVGWAEDVAARRRPSIWPTLPRSA